MPLQLQTASLNSGRTFYTRGDVGNDAIRQWTEQQPAHHFQNHLVKIPTVQPTIHLYEVILEGNDVSTPPGKLS